MKTENNRHRRYKSSEENRILRSRLEQNTEKIPDDFTYDDLESWKYAHQSHCRIMEFVNNKIKNS